METPALFDHEDMAPNPRATIGDNKPDPFVIDPETRADFDARIKAFLAGADIWAERGEFDEDLAQRANDFLTGAAKLYGEADKARLAETKALRDETTTRNAWWNERLDKIERIKAVVQRPLKVFLAKKKVEDEAKRRAAEAEARAAEEAARLAALEAANATTTSAQIDADARAAALAEQAEEAQRAAKAAAEPTRVESATGAGNRRGLKLKRHIEITSLPMAIAFYLKRPAGRAAIERLVQQMAEAHVRELGVKTPLVEIAIDGVKVTESEEI